MPCDIDSIKKICKKKKIILIEDCAQSLGAKIKNKYTGTYGDMSVFSFHQQKNMTTLGEGGMLVVNNKKFQKYIPGLRHNGHRAYPNKKKYWKPAMVDVYEDLRGVAPFNFPMTEITSVKGDDAHSIYKWAKKSYGNSASPKWNFHKILIDQNGRVVDTFAPFTKPTSKKILKAIDKLIS